MRNTKTKGKTMTKALSKCHKRFIAHNEVQWAYADILEGNEDINEIKCNVKLLGCELGENYSSDFVCTKSNGELLVVETVFKKHLLKPLNLKLLEESRKYWLARGVQDWRLVVGDKNEKVIKRRIIKFI